MIESVIRTTVTAVIALAIDYDAYLCLNAPAPYGTILYFSQAFIGLCVFDYYYNRSRK